jgi:predicted DNA-binding transcriptional regulator AlpA
MKKQTHNTADALSPLLLDARGVAQLLSVSRATVYTLHSTGKLPRPIRPTGHDPRWSLAELRDWTSAGCPSRETWEQTRAAQR